MRAPLETLLQSVATAKGLAFTAVAEASLADVTVRPDYAAKVSGAITGYIEVKAPGTGADPTRWKVAGHDGKQWAYLSALPDVLCTDGECWGLYRTGEPFADVVRLSGDIRRAGALTADGDAPAREGVAGHGPFTNLSSDRDLGSLSHDDVRVTRTRFAMRHRTRTGDRCRRGSRRECVR
ncbi:MAG: hypothetical protein ACYC90_12695 [Candidatus Nanopelagicales bacterium]